jgi:hypothetical protein
MNDKIFAIEFMSVSFISMLLAFIQPTLALVLFVFNWWAVVAVMLFLSV